MEHTKNWPDEVRLKMIEKSEFYQEPQVYQYGFYDGYQHRNSEVESLRETVKELREALDELLTRFVANEKDTWDKKAQWVAKAALTRSQHLK